MLVTENWIEGSYFIAVLVIKKMNGCVMNSIVLTLNNLAIYLGNEGIWAEVLLKGGRQGELAAKCLQKCRRAAIFKLKLHFKAENKCIHLEIRKFSKRFKYIQKKGS